MDDYPPKALREKREGITELTVRVDVNGQAKDCVVTKSSGSSDLDKAACKLIVRRAVFKPATDGDGNKIEAPYATKVTWTIER